MRHIPEKALERKLAYICVYPWSAFGKVGAKALSLCVLYARMTLCNIPLAASPQKRFMHVKLRRNCMM
jgi:hypothetical protein